MPEIDVEAIAREWLNQCGSCDFGLPYPCTCPSEDYRGTMLSLVEEVKRLQREVETKTAVALANKRALKVALEYSVRLQRVVDAAVALHATAHTSEPWALEPDYFTGEEIAFDEAVRAYLGGEVPDASHP